MNDVKTHSNTLFINVSTLFQYKRSQQLKLRNHTNTQSPYFDPPRITPNGGLHLQPVLVRLRIRLRLRWDPRACTVAVAVLWRSAVHFLVRLGFVRASVGRRATLRGSLSLRLYFHPPIVNVPGL